MHGWALPGGIAHTSYLCQDLSNWLVIALGDMSLVTAQVTVFAVDFNIIAGPFNLNR